LTSSVLAAPLSALPGDQLPRILHVPPYVSTETGRQAIELAASAGLILDPWQCLVLEQSLAEDARGRWAAFEVGLVVARQNGKGSILEARELAGLFLLDERVIIHSAHRFETSLEAFRRILELIEGTPAFDRRVKRVSKSHGDEGIELRSGARLRFKTRTASGGRGLTGDCVILDEAMILPTATVGALMPTMAARSVSGNPQLWYTGSAGNEFSDVLGRIRRRGMAGDDPSLCYLEWSVADEAYAANPYGVAASEQAWAQANPGKEIRISGEHIAREHRSMDRTEFARERLSIGTWPLDEEAAKVIPSQAWRSCADTASTIAGQMVFGVDTTMDRSRTSIAVAGGRSDGLRHLEVIDNQPGTHWVIERALQLDARWHPAGWVLDPGGPSGSMIADFEAANLKVIPVTSREIAQASAGLHDDVVNDRVRHLDDIRLNEAVLAAKKRTLGDGWAFDRRTDVDSSPLLAVTLARHGHTDAVRPPSVYEERGLVSL
jgi:hypothetical protein